MEDGVRAKIYGILRIPLNCFVVLGLMLTKDGEFFFFVSLRSCISNVTINIILNLGLRHRENVFMICSGALASAAAAMGAFVTE